MFRCFPPSITRTPLSIKKFLPALLAVAFVLPGFSVSSAAQSGDWDFAGQDLGNTRNQPKENKISASNASSLKLTWSFTTAASVSSTPTVSNGRVYFPDWAGNLYSVNESTGKLDWQTKISSYTGIPTDLSRTSPAVYGNELILGDNQSEDGPHDGVRLMAVDRRSGKLLWITKVDPHPAAIITGSAVVNNGIVYQGIASAEEEYARNPAYPCCTFRGSMVAVDANTGQILWKTYTVPDNGGATDQYSGNGIWQPPVIDPARGALYVATGNNYTAPADVEACQANNPQSSTCTAPDDFFNSVIAMDLQTGAIRWGHKLSGWDAWTVACAQPGNPGACPSPPGPNWDFGGSGGNLMGSVVGFGQKSGMYWALNTADGTIAWSTQMGPGGNLGGLQWGTATDGQRVYATLTNNEHNNYPLVNGQTITGSAWNALDASTGHVLWQTPDPAQGDSFNMGAVSVANGVMYSGDMDGHMYALDAATGKILWSYQAGGTVLDGPAISQGYLYWGSGYRRSGGTPDNKVYAFSVR
jgi:polyvinyl alcohol dehydrogenase (cytochrome)